MTYSYRHILIIIIACILLLILCFFIAAVSRRILNGRKYAALDRYREWYRRKITDALRANRATAIVEDLRARPGSIPWRAVEEVLFEQIAAGRYVKEATQLFLQLGYRDHYEKKLRSNRAIIKAAAADKLGKMLSEASTANLVQILNDEEDPEILTVAVRALCRIRSQDGLKGILERLPELYAKSLISQKTIEASLIHFSSDAVPLLVAQGKRSDDPRIKASLLEVLSRLPATPTSFSFAAANLSASDAEVRSKAIRVFGRHAAAVDEFNPQLLIPLLQDPVWFVRLQAARALESLRFEPSVHNLGGLLLDSNWQVRNAAARALANIGDASLDVFLNILKDRDRYAKESICEEAERTHFTEWLIGNLESRDPRIYEKSRDILRIMHSLNFSTSLLDYLNNGEKGPIKHEIGLLLKETAYSTQVDQALGKIGDPGTQIDGDGSQA